MDKRLIELGKHVSASIVAGTIAGAVACTWAPSAWAQAKPAPAAGAAGAKPDLAAAKKHYAEHVQKGWYPTLENFITGGPVVAAIVEGLEAVRVVREMLGATSGLKAAAGTIRGDFSSSRQMNLVHASDGAEAAEREIKLYFSPQEIVSYEPTITRWLRAADET